MIPSIISFLGKIIGVSLLVIAIVAIGGNILIHYYPTVSGHYSYVVSITGLSGYQGDPIMEIVVPVPAIGGSPVFSEKDLQRMGSDNCTPLPVMTKDGEMLALRFSGKNLTDVSVVQSRDFSKDPSLEEMQEGVFVPTSSRLFEARNTSDDFPYIIIPDSLHPISSYPEPISVSINFSVFGSTTFGEHRPDYLVSIMEQIPPGKTGIIPVEPQIYYRDSLGEAFHPLEGNVSIT
jgi:hypothetical protein